MKKSKRNDAEFKNHLIAENRNRLLLLLVIVAISQLAFILIELAAVMPWDTSVFLSRLGVIFLCLIFMVLIYFLGKQAYKKNRFKALGVIISVVQGIIVIVGCAFVVFMFDSGIYSFSVYLLVSYVVSITCVRSPYITGVILLPFLIASAIYINFTRLSFSVWFGEFIIAIVYLSLLYFGNIFDYKRHLRLFMQDRDLTKMNDKLEALSQIDELTGVYNRRKIWSVLGDYAVLAEIHKTPFCAAMLDLDHFKKVNDEHGHSVGDDVLYHFANNIRFMLRSNDVFGRWGGEEFIILMPNCKETEAYELLEIIRKSIENYDFPVAGRVTFSAGISSYIGENDISGLIDKADKALYMAKRSGRNKICIYQIE